MSEKSDKKQNLWQVVKFTLFSASAALIEIGVDELLVLVFHAPETASYFVALVASVLWNFTFNRRYTFRSDGNVLRAMLLVALYYVVFTPLTTWDVGVLTGMGVPNTVVVIGNMLVNFVTEFLYQRLVVYRDTIDTNDVARRAREKK